MDKSRMTFTFRPTPREPANEMKPFREIPKNPYQKERFRSSFRNTSREYGRNHLNKPPLPGRGTWLLPALLAAVTGIALGLGVLFVFKNGASDLHPTVETVGPQGNTAAQETPVMLPGIQLTAYQVGVYKDLDRAKKGASEFEKIGIYPVVRTTDSYQLLVGAAVDKTQGQSIEDALNKAQVHFYAKDYSIAEKKGPMPGITGKDAATLAGILTQSVQLTKGGIEVASDPAKKAGLDIWKQKLQSFSGQADMARKILEKSGKKGELVRFNDMLEQLQNTAVSFAKGKNVLETERYLVQSLIDYEELVHKLIP